MHGVHVRMRGRLSQRTACGFKAIRHAVVNDRFWRILPVAAAAAFWRTPTVPGPPRERVLRVELTPSWRSTLGDPKLLASNHYDGRLRIERLAALVEDAPRRHFRRDSPAGSIFRPWAFASKRLRQRYDFGPLLRMALTPLNLLAGRRALAPARGDEPFVMPWSAPCEGGCAPIAIARATVGSCPFRVAPRVFMTRTAEECKNANARNRGGCGGSHGDESPCLRGHRHRSNH